MLLVLTMLSSGDITPLMDERIVVDRVIEPLPRVLLNERIGEPTIEFDLELLLLRLFLMVLAAFLIFSALPPSFLLSSL